MQRSPHPGQRLVVLFCLFSLVPACHSTGAAADASGVRVPDRFEATLFADDDLAHDVFAMAVDSLGRVVVSGPGYVRILIDRDGDGKADAYKQFADGPKTGAQGMFFDGRDLICTGDAGLIRYRDRDGDDRADGPPELLLRIKAGGEHDAHAVRRGPDGWWYVLAGNNSELTAAYASLPTSPIRNPEAGALLRLAPDFRRGEILADGFRNAYDFAFDGQGDVFVYDSDGERDISLPWYRPTRVFHTLPGSHAGWVSRSWKRPAGFADMPPVVGAFGRGSPTGVACYRHTQFPAPYRGALFVLDWTFGRVIALPLEPSGSTWDSEPISFMTGVGQFGFAPTDATVGPDGSLYVSIGGRGTRGGVYRVRYVGQVSNLPGTRRSRESSGTRRVENLPHTPGDKLTACLTAPQPLSSWSRARWVPVAKELGREPLTAAALDEKRPPPQRVRAVEILTELFGGVDARALGRLAKSSSAEVRARAAWSIGRTQPPARQGGLLRAYLGDENPLVRRCALEALVGADAQFDFDAIVPVLAERLGDEDRFVRQSAARIVPRLKPPVYKRLADLAVKSGDRAALTFALGRVRRLGTVDLPALRVGMRIIENGSEPRGSLVDEQQGRGTARPVSAQTTRRATGLTLDAVRLMQLALGDVGPRPNSKLPPVFDGYSSRIDLNPHERQLDPFRVKLARAYPTGDRTVDAELARLVAMLAPYNPDLLERVLAQVTRTSHPVDDIHHLIVAARIPVARDPRQSEAIAAALVALEAKIASRGLNQDSNWDDRVGEMYKELARIDGALPTAVARHSGFGRPGHVIFLSELSDARIDEAIAAFAKKIGTDAEYQWTTDVVFVLGRSSDPAHRELVRRQFDTFAVRSAVLMVLAEKPEEQDRSKFLEGLESSQLEVLTACVKALSELPPSRAGGEQVALVKALRRLGRDRGEFPVRDEIVKLLRRNTGQNFGFILGENGHQPQTETTEKWTDWIARAYPDEAARRLGAGGGDAEELRALLGAVDWKRGDLERGRALFETRACARCHGGRRALGPDLAGVARRFSREDLFTAIALPNRDVSPRYQTTLIQTTGGKVYSGLVIYESVDGVTLRDANNQTIRIEAGEIEERRVLTTSLMPTGLLKDLRPRELADLDAYLRSLN